LATTECFIHSKVGVIPMSLRCIGTGCVLPEGTDQPPGSVAALASYFSYPLCCVVLCKAKLF